MSDFTDIKWSPTEYQQAAFLARDAGEEMLSRLDWMTIEPQVIVDVGCGTGELAAALAKRYTDAKVYALDSSAEMLAVAEQHQAIECLQQDASKIALPDQSVDLICANFLLPWVTDINVCFKEWRRVLKDNGLLMVSALGVGTLEELQGSVKPEAMPALIDMHNIGDALVAAGFVDPVMDVGRFPVRYRNGATLQKELCASGILKSAVTFSDDLLVTYEVVHGHAFTPLASSEFAADDEGVVRVPLSHLRKSFQS